MSPDEPDAGGQAQDPVDHRMSATPTPTGSGALPSTGHMDQRFAGLSNLPSVAPALRRRTGPVDECPGCALVSAGPPQVPDDDLVGVAVDP